jgi:hypothetical protein
MIRKIIPIAAIALAIGTLTVAPRVATAASPTSSVTVSAVVPTSATVTTTSATLASWTAANQTATFTVTVTTSDSNGWTFNFYDSSATTSNYEPTYTLTGQAHSNTGQFGIFVPYAGANQFYLNEASPGTGSPKFTTSAAPITFTCSFSTPPTVADTYTDTVTVAVNLL